MTMTRATKNSWKHIEYPAIRENLQFEALFTNAEAEKLMQGLIPEQMEDKWFIYFSEGWLFFLRSWTGACIYAIKFHGVPNGVCITDSWVNRVSEQYSSVDVEYDKNVVRILIDSLLKK